MVDHGLARHNPRGGIRVRCPACGRENPEGAKFCGECAAPLAQAAVCAGCGASNPAGQKFCNECGSPIAPVRETRAPRVSTPSHLAEKILDSKRSLEGERKLVTVLFADVKGSMDLAAAIDPEDWRGIMDRFFSLLCDGIHRFEGTVDKFTGDGIMALFGAPIAHEDHAHRACYAALQMKDALAAYAGDLRREQGLSFSVRMGLNSGEVVVGAIGDDLEVQYTAIGHTVGLAQRIEQIAEPGKAYVTERTAALVSGYFDLRDLGAFELKGVPGTLGVFELAGVGGARTRLDVARAKGLSRFVGRDEEAAGLERAFEQALADQGQAIGVAGEAGVGKSRLCFEFLERCRTREVGVYEGHGVAHGKSVPLLPILEWWRDYFHITDGDDDRTAREKIAGRLLLIDENFKDALPLVFEFLGVPDPARPAPRMNPEARQRQLFGAMKRLVRGPQRREPVVVLLEDLHWFDPASEAFLENFVDAIPGTPTLVLTTFRPEYRASWMRKSYYRQLPLTPLGPEAMAELLHHLLGAHPSLDGLPELVRERTGGNPFFIEEVVQALVENGSLEGDEGAYRLARPIEELAIPPTVQAVLAARIDRLAEREKLVLQTAAVVGSEFSEPVLARVVHRDDLSAALSALVRAEFLYEEALYPEAEYAFKHPLTQEVAYGSQLAERRAATHAAVARSIADLDSDKLDERAALLAHHWEHAGEALEAARWSSRAALWAGPIHPAEALRHWHRVRALLDEVEQSEETLGLGLAACVQTLNLGWRLGIAEDEAAEVYATGIELAARTADVAPRALMTGVYGLTRGVAGHVTEALEHSLEAARLAEEVEDDELRLGLRNTAFWHYCVGDLREALSVAEGVIELTKDDLSIGTRIIGLSVHIWCLMFSGFLLAFLGELDEAEHRLERSIVLAREHDELETLGWALGARSQLAYLRGELEGVMEPARQSLEIAERLGSSWSRVVANSQIARAHLVREEWREAVEACERALHIARERRTGLAFEGLVLPIKAEAALHGGDARAALATAEEAVAVTRRRRTRFFEAGALMSLGRVRLGLDDSGVAAYAGQALTEAIAIAQETGGRSLEPFARVDLAEVARRAGDTERSHEELRLARDLFTEIGAGPRAADLTAQIA
jgi:class 3 adenylate cyclase/tetratricopeptide (TPR) repeat protein